MKNRLNKGNRPRIRAYIEKHFDLAARRRGDGTVSLIDIWDVGFEIEKRFGLSDPAAQGITWELLRERGQA